MQNRHKDRGLYFKELAYTSKYFFLPYISTFRKIESITRVLEVGCGDGGNLLPFAEIGCKVIGVDISITRIHDARAFFKEKNAKATFIASDVFALKELYGHFDIIICHDVIGHISDKFSFLTKFSRFLLADGIMFVAFPAWQMPFGGHQQICKSRLLSHLPYFHLLPAFAYEGILKVFKESNGCIDELLSIKETKCSIEYFERTLRKCNLNIVDRCLYLINPHYKVKFGLSPIKQNSIISALPYIRNYFTTSAFYIINKIE